MVRILINTQGGKHILLCCQLRHLYVGFATLSLANQNKVTARKPRVDDSTCGCWLFSQSAAKLLDREHKLSRLLPITRFCLTLWLADRIFALFTALGSLRSLLVVKENSLPQFLSCAVLCAFPCTKFWQKNTWKINKKFWQKLLDGKKNDFVKFINKFVR